MGITLRTEQVGSPLVIEEINAEVTEIYLYNENGILFSLNQGWFTDETIREYLKEEFTEVTEITLNNLIRAEKENFNLKCNFYVATNLESSVLSNRIVELYLYVDNKNISFEKDVRVETHEIISRNNEYIKEIKLYESVIGGITDRAIHITKREFIKETPTTKKLTALELVKENENTELNYLTVGDWFLILGKYQIKPIEMK